MSPSLVAISDLPKSLRDVAETLGIGVALKLIQTYGGAEIKFPNGLATIITSSRPLARKTEARYVSSCLGTPSMCRTAVRSAPSAPMS